MLDLLIVGGGPAGLTAGLYAARAGLDALLLENAFVGGQASTTNMIENYPGFPDGVGGPELMMQFDQQAEAAGLKIAYGEVRALALAGAEKRAATEGESYAARAMILCMGATRRTLGVPGEAENVGRGVSYCATCDGAFYKGRAVAVVGGGDTAAEDALYLARFSPVTLIHRRGELRVSGHAARLLRENENITLLLETVVERIERADGGLSLICRNVRSGETRALSCAGCFVAVGTAPNTALVAGQVALDEAGYVIAGEDTQTSLPGVFCAGDIRVKPLKQVVTAVADGAVAATMAQRYLAQ